MNTLSRTLLAVTASALVLTACGDSAESPPAGPASTAGTIGPGGDDSSGRQEHLLTSLPTVGEVPAVVSDGEDVEVTSCELHPDHPDRAVVEAVVTNLTDSPAQLQGVALTVRDQDGAEVSRPDALLWSPIVISPGRQALHRAPVFLESQPESITCEVERKDVREHPWSDFEGLADVELVSCAPVRVQVENPHDSEVGVRVGVEVFDNAGHSIGMFDLAQWPTYYQDGEHTETLNVALPAGESTELEIDPQDRIKYLGIPTDGVISGCQIVSVEIVTDPAPSEVMYD